MALVHDDIAKELKSIELSFEQMALDTSVSPSEGLKASIWKDIDAKESTTPVVAMDTSTPADSATSGFNWARAASIAAIVGLSALAWNGHQEKKSLSAQLEKESKAAQVYAESLQENQNRLAQLERDLSIVGSPDFTAVTMKGTPNAPRSIAQVYWNAESSEVFLNVETMTPLPSGKVYQLWALDGGIPVDAGTFKDSTKGLIKMKAIQSGQTFAVTIENEGGAETPALETLQVIGNVPVTS
jgi:anti-sigma-K factor RskA